MSELINTQQTRNMFRWQLLSTVSSLALLTSVCGMQRANAEDADRPTVWIELGADLDHVNSGQQAFAPPFVVNNPGSTAFDPVSPAEAQKTPGFSFGGEGKLSFQPEDSSWIFSASIRYARANANRFVHQTAKNNAYYEHVIYKGHYGTQVIIPPTHYTPFAANFLHASEKLSESHAVVDFQAGRDFGLGLFGRGGTSVLNAGVRFAQFTSSMQSNMQARPDIAFVVFHFPTQGTYPNEFGTFNAFHYHQYLATAQSARSFHGIGPSLSWNASAPFAGNSENGELSVDWGANAAILFGRQKAKVQHHTSAQYFASHYASRKYPDGGGAAGRWLQSPAGEPPTCAHRHGAKCWRLRGRNVWFQQRQSQRWLSRRFLLRCDGHRLRYGEALHNRLLRTLRQRQRRAGRIGKFR